MNAVRKFWPVLVAWVILLALETLCQVSLKFAGSSIGAFNLNRASVLAAISTPWLWVAIGCYLGAFLAWMTILSKSSLSSAYPTSAIVFVSVMIASWLVFGEPVGWDKALGSGIIVAGILLLGGERTEHGTARKHTMEAPLEDGQRADGRMK
ncbi:MAG TPA: EamA family transporter [Rhodanobacteraceae bacterium]|nr:EamA family transporter [Rhodanobacteraceae bacterium]